MTEEELDDEILTAPATIFLRKMLRDYVGRLKAKKQLAETQLKELLSALYKRTDNKDKSFTIYQKDIVELAKGYGIKEEELK